jgi:hypothetical protein
MYCASRLCTISSENCDFKSAFQYNKIIISETMTEMFEYVNPRNGQYAPLIADDVYKVIQCGVLDSHITGI